MKIGVVLTPEQQDRIFDNSKATELSKIMNNKPEYNKESGSYTYNGVEYVTENEAYEATDEREI